MKTFFKTLAFCMIFILFLSCVTSLFDFGDEPTGPGNIVQKPPTDTQEPDEPTEPEEPEEPSCTHVDADDNELCDLCGESFSDGIECSHADVDDNALCDNCNEAFEDGCDLHRDSDDDNACDTCGESFSDGQDLFGGIVINDLTFSNLMYKDATEGIKNNVVQAGYSVGGVKTGIITTEDGYLKFSTDAYDNENVDTFISLFMKNQSTENLSECISIDTFDYMTIDFDVWTDSNFFDYMIFRFQGKDESESASFDKLPYLVIVNNGNSYLASSYETDIPLKTISVPSEKVHITYVIDNASLYARTRIYVNGEYLCGNLSLLSDTMSEINFLRVYFSSGFVDDGRSVCFDNFVVSTFGSGNEAYTGAISELFGDTSINLAECVDSVLYNKNN